MSKKFLIIDGSSMLSTAYYGNLPKQILFAKTEEEKEKYYGKILQTSGGVYTNGMYTMLMTLFATLKKVKPDYIAFVFDQSRNTFRRTELGADFYKANRSATPVPLKEQFINMENFLEESGFQCLYNETYEADDYAATLVEKFSSPELQTYVLTKDHDYFQIINPYTRMWRPCQKEKLEELREAYGWGMEGIYDNLPSGVFEYTPDIVKAEEGVPPEKIVDLLAIVGDPGDGIPGCTGVKSAAVPLINEYGSIENLYAYIDECSNEKEEKVLATFWKESLGIKRSPMKALKTNREMVFLSKQLATMKRDITLEQELEDFAYKIEKEKLIEQLKKYEMNSLLSQAENL